MSTQGSESVREIQVPNDTDASKPFRWEGKIRDMLSELDESRDLSIYKVPSRLRNVKKDAYSPRVVPIGPLQGENPDDYAFMMGHKCVYMLLFLQKTPVRSDTYRLLNNCVNALHNYKDSDNMDVDFDKIVRRHYSEKFEKIVEDELVKTMIVDGCFILELFLRFDKYCKHMNLVCQSDDPIFSNAWMITALRHDLALLENQIPFFVLNILYETLKSHLIRTRHELPPSITSLALNFFLPMNQNAMKEPRNPGDCKHLLDFLHSCSFLPGLESKVYLTGVSGTEINRHPDGRLSINLTIIESTSQNQVQPNSRFLEAADPESKQKQGWGFDFCATELVETGIKFQTQVTQSNEGRLLNMEFSNGVIRNFPPMSIYETADFSLLRNLIAYEQCSLHRSHHITSFASLMKSLIRSPWDIKLLRREGILNHNQVEDEVYFTRFKDILDEVVVTDFCYDKLCKEVNAYARKFWVWRGVKSIYRTYFSKAWSLISFIAAVFLFGLTCVQTYFSVIPRN